MGILNNLFIRAVGKAYAAGEQDGLTGNGIDPVITVPDRPNHVYARVVQGSALTVLECLNGGVGELPDIPVKIRWLDGVPVVTRPDFGRIEASVGDERYLPTVPPHSHDVGSGSGADLVEEKRGLWGLVREDDALTVYVEKFWYWWQGAQRYWPGGSLDLAGEQGTAGFQRWVKVGLDPVVPELVSKAGAEYPALVTLFEADLAALAFDEGNEVIPLGGVRLLGTATAWSNEAEFVSARLLNTTPMHDAGDIQYVPSSAGDWTDPDPVTVQEALDDLAARESGPGGSTSITVTAGEALSELDHVYRDASDNKWYKFDNDSTTATGVERAIVTESGGIATDATGTAQQGGELAGFTGLTAGEKVWASGTAGGYTQTEPSPSSGGAQVAAALIGVAQSTTTILLYCLTPLQILKRDSLANNATLTLTHPADPNGRHRRVRVYVSTSAGSEVAEEHGTGNQDTQIQLRGQSASGGSTANTTGTTTGGAIGDGSGSEYENGMSFQVAAGWLTQFTFDLNVNLGSPSGDITWRIETESGGLPSGTVLLTGTMTPTPNAQNTVNIAAGELLLSASTSYWLTLSVAPQATNNYYDWKQDGGNPYANGYRAYRVNGGAWNAISEYDLVFSVTTSAITAFDKLAQSFQLMSGITCDKAQLDLRKVGSPTGTMTLRIETDNAGDPSGTLVDANATVTVAESSLSTSLALVDFDFASSFSLSASTTYWLVLSTDRSASDSNYVEWGAEETGSYADGESGTEASSTWTTPAADADDFIFAIYAEGTAYEEPIVVGRWSGGTRDGAVRYDDGSGTNPDTQTTIKNVTGGSADLTLVVELGVES
jgi:hypothetical protein